MKPSPDLVLPDGIALGARTPLPTICVSDQESSAFDALCDGFRRHLAASEEPNSYAPYLFAVRSHSHGYIQRVPSASESRVYHLLSRREFQLFMLLQWARVEKILEQFPLPQALTLDLAKRTETRHPAHWKEPTVMSVDFLVRIGPNKWAGVDFKLFDHAQRKRTRDKLQLSALALAQLGIPHFTVTEKDLPETIIRNYEWLYVHQLRSDGLSLRTDLLREIERQLYSILTDGRTTIFRAACEVARMSGESSASLARTCYWLIAQRIWRVDMRFPIGPDYALHFS